jgi:hypothetical protein
VEERLAAAGGAAAVFAFVAGAVASHHAPTLGAERRIGNNVGLEWKGLLRFRQGGPQLQNFTSFGRFRKA